VTKEYHIMTLMTY